VDLSVFAVEELAQPLVPFGFGRLGVAFGFLLKCADRFEQRVPPAVGRGLGAPRKPVVLLLDLAGCFAREDD
jgi:hypothetical protein